MTDPISDLLARIRNAQVVRHPGLSVPASKIKLRVCEVLKEQGYIDGFSSEEDGKQGLIHIDLKYLDNAGADPAIAGLKRVSRPGRRVYVGAQQLPRVQGGMGIAIISTSKGVITDREARKQKVGGEVLCAVW